MLSLRSLTTAIGLAFVAGCARQENPVASPVANVEPASSTPPASSAPSEPREGEAQGEAKAEREAEREAEPKAEPPRASKERDVLAANAPAPVRGDTISLGSVRMGNQRPLKAIAVPFATYLVKIHIPIHRAFSDKALGTLDALASNDPLNNPRLVTRLELVLDGATGAIARLEVVKPSSVAAFDALAKDAVGQAGPFGEAPPEIRSSDGNVYVHWDLGREPTFGCAPVHARPFLLSIASPAVARP